MRKVYCYAEKEEKPEEIDHSGDIVQDLSSLDISDLKNRSFFFIGGEIIENPYYEPSEYMKRVYESIDAQYEKFYRSDKDKKDSEEKDGAKDAEEEINEQSSDDEMPDWIAEMPYGELIKKFPGGISEALEYAKKEKGLSVPEVHYDSPEPEKLGVKAFTKNAEVYLAPGEGEETFKHELGHVIQQKKEKIPATTKIGEQQVNLDPKLEQEADEFAEHIEDHITEIISNESTNTETKDVLQCELPSDRELGETIRNVAQHNNIPAVIMDDEKVNDILKKIKLQYKDDMSLSLELFHRDVRDDPDFMLKMQVRKELEKDAECGIYLSLSEYKHRVGDRADDERKESERINEIMDMLSTEKIFADSGNPTYTLHTIMQWLTPDQCQKVKKYILELKKYCDAKGIKSALESANENASPYKVIMQLSDDSPGKKSNLAKYFLTRLKLITDYIERVTSERDADGKLFSEKYWIRSTGSDPHKNGEHALFLVGKKSGKIERVYKPHDLSADDAVVGGGGIFAQTNKIIKNDFIKRATKLGLGFGESSDDDPLATMEINPNDQTEEFVPKKDTMSQSEAKLYFFRCGILKVITDTMAIVDLHGNNIFPTNGGPMIIDAEIDFFHYGLDSCLTDALINPFVGTKQAESFFTISQDTVNTSSAAEFEKNESEYYKMYKEGCQFMWTQMLLKKEIFMDIFEQQLQKTRQIRLFPLDTSEFATALQNVIEQTENMDTTAKRLKDNIIESFKTNFLDTNHTEIEFYDNLKDELLTTLKNGTIPAMYGNIHGQIYLDDRQVGKIHIKTPGQNLIDIMKKCFESSINNPEFLRTLR